MDFKVPAAQKPERFNTTRWSLVAAAQDDATGRGSGALLQLCLHYWYPVYVYIRHRGHAPQAAQDLARAFFDDLVGRQLSSYSAQPDHQFRDFLLAALNRFLAQDPFARANVGAPSVVVPPTDTDAMEARHQSYAVAALTPEQAYQRGYGLALMTCALDRLRREAHQSGHGTLLETLEPFLTQDAAPGEYEEVATRLGMRALGVAMAAKRLRQRFRELVEDELSETVGSPAALDAERDALRRALL